MKNKIFPLSMVLLWTLTFGTAMHNWPVGIGMGLCMGVVFGLFDQDEENEGKPEESKKGDDT